MKKRGIKDLKKVSCSPLSPGYFVNEPYGDRRVLKVPCYELGTGTSHLYGRPITGVFAVVDVEEKRVLDVVDLGVVALPPQPDPARVPRAALKPVQMTSSQGRNYKIKGAIQIEWDNWSFHMRMERRTGPVISLVRYNDRGKKRLIAYQMSLSEMFVPYMDPGADWSYRTFMDSGEFGAGFLMSSLMAGSDCPADAAYVTMAVPNDTGRSFPVRRAACIFERNTGDPLWRHGNPAQPTNLTRPQVELVVRMIPVLGNTDYIIDWVFTHQGDINVRVALAGIAAVKGVTSATMNNPFAGAETANGTLVAPGTVVPLHDHFFNFRLDLDVDGGGSGAGNSLIRDSIVPKRLPQSNPRRSLWVVDSKTITSEGPLAARGHNGTWRVVNPNRKTALGHNPGFEIVTGNQSVSTLAEDDDPQRRAGFAARTLWLTRQNPRELFAAGDYPTQARGGGGLPQYVADSQNVVNKDLVVWLTVGIHHIPRVEDWPVMPTEWYGFKLRPFNFFDENPAFNIPAGFATTTSEVP
ncbi:MAG: tyramine oxidase, partial [Hyphomicrobiales bacterium]